VTGIEGLSEKFSVHVRISFTEVECVNRSKNDFCEFVPALAPSRGARLFNFLAFPRGSIPGLVLAMLGYLLGRSLATRHGLAAHPIKIRERLQHCVVWVRRDSGVHYGLSKTVLNFASADFSGGTILGRRVAIGDEVP
jgi:hypothetical protein